MVSALEVTGLNKRFGRSVALDEVTVSIEPGASVALFGPNGAGKSTFLRLCATLLRPTHGSIRIFGHDAVEHSVTVRRRLGSLGHDSYLYPDLTTTENLQFYARLYGIPRPAERIAELIERMGLTGWAHRTVRTLSRGLLQRCALARVTLHEPDLIFLDEPFTGLDIDGAATLREVLAETSRRGATILMSTHDLPAALQICNQGMILARGRLAWYGSIAGTDPADFTRDYHNLTRSPDARSSL